MSQIHVLDGNGGVYRVVVHAATPVGNNSAGISWATALVNSGRAKTVMAEGNGPGQITTAEKNAVVAGTTMEASFSWQDDPSMSNAQRQADITLRATQLIADMQARYADQLKFYGYSSG